jgi:hypothetical protein
MNAAQLHRMQEAKRASDERRRVEYTQQKADFLEWLGEERLAYGFRALMIDVMGRDSDEFAEAHETWIGLLRNAPRPPPDHAW